MTTLDELKRLCNRSHDHLSEPFKVQVFGEWHDVATDGYGFLAIRRENPEAREMPAGHELVPKSVIRMIGEDPLDPSTAIKTTVEKVLSWTGAPQWEFPCDECEATGSVMVATDLRCDVCSGTGTLDCMCECGDCHEKDCAECKGTGELPGDPEKNVACEGCAGSGKTDEVCHASADRRVGMIALLRIDMIRLARLVSTLSGPCEVFAVANKLLHLRCAGSWYAVLMMIHEDATTVFEP